MQMNVQLHHAVTDITGVTGMRILRAIVAGERVTGGAGQPTATCAVPPRMRRCGPR